MINNLKENQDRLNMYLKNKSYSNIDIIDLVKYIYIKFGANLKSDILKQEKLSKLINIDKKVLLVLVDGMGYYKVKELNDSYIMKNNLKHSIQTVNPTSTVCILNSIATATYPACHGIFGWWQYIKKGNINACPLKFVERKTGIKLNEKGIDAKYLFGKQSVLSELKCDVNVCMSRDIIGSEFSTWFCGNHASTHGFYSIKEGFENLSNKISSSTSSFNYMYIDGLDLASHRYGTKSDEVKNIIDEIDSSIIKLKEQNKDTTVIVTADHGQVDMVNMMYLNQKNDYTKYFYALPSIDTRMISFFVKDEFREEFETTFSNEFSKDVILLKKEEIKKHNLFGNISLTKKADDAIGEYVGIVVNNKFMISDKLNLEDEMDTKGNHSGLTKEETTIPLIVI